MLPEHLLQPLREDGYEPQVVAEGGLICVVVPGFRLPAGYQPDHVDLLLRLPVGFPDVPPDMYWVDPVVSFARDGAAPAASEQRESYVGRVWQRFSRHLAPDAWRSGCDDLNSYLTLIFNDLKREAATRG